MALFDAPDINKRPTHWRDFSYDFRFLYVYFGCMAALFMLGGSLTVREELAAAAILMAILVALSLKHRQNMNWQWPGIRTKRILTAVWIIVAAAVLDYVAGTLAPPSDPRFLPWHLGGLGLAAFEVLVFLNVVQTSKTDFLRECALPGSVGIHPPPAIKAIPTAPLDPLWKRTIRGTYYVFAFLVWAGFMVSIYEFGVAFQNGFSHPTKTNPDPLNSHGALRYIPHSQKVLINSLDKTGSIGIPAVIAVGLALHFFLGVKMFQNMPTYEEWRKQRSSRG